MLVGVPKEIKNDFDIKEGDTLGINAIVVEEEDLKEKKELKRLTARYPYSGEGVIIHDGEVVAKLNQILYMVKEEISYGYNFATQESQELTKKWKIYGIIIKGNFLPIAYDNKHYGKHLKEPRVQKSLTGSEIIKIKLDNGKEGYVESIEFLPTEGVILNENNYSIDKIEFKGFARK